MLTSAQIRQQFLDFFREKQHTIVRSSSLMPDSPNLLFTNAGMNQFVPIFLNEVPCPYTPGRAADTQKCIRAGGKHNDLDDVGLDTYHHTFFEMLGNWSFGDYFKKEAIEWAWELIVERWKFPAQRVYATIYQPDKGDPAERDQEAWEFWAEKFRSKGLDPAVHIVDGNKKDNFWMMGETGPCGPCSELHVDLTPAGDTRGLLVNQGTAECIEIWNLVFIQFNAQPVASAVPAESALGQRTLHPAVEFVPLPATHVDTGMGFERVASIIQGTKGFTDFANARISNYETDIFRPIFDELEKMSGKRYGSTLPGGQKETIQAPGAIATEKTAAPISGGGGVPAVGGAPAASGGGVPVGGGSAPVAGGGVPPNGGGVAPSGGRVPGAGGGVPAFGGAPISAIDAPAPSGGAPEARSAAPAGNGGDQIALDVAFRVIADHIRTLSFAIADGIQPGNTDRNYVLRRILRRAVRYGRTLGFHEPFFYKLVAVLARTMGDVFPEIRARQKHVEEVLRREEEAFNRTLDRGIELFEREAARLLGSERARQDAGHSTLEACAPQLQSHVGPGAISKAEELQPGSARFQRVGSGFQPEPSSQSTHYSKRNLPHYERPHAIYHVTFSTRDRRILSPAARTLVRDAFVHVDQMRYDLFAVCVMPDHVHALLQPRVKELSPAGESIFWPLGELLHSIKSYTANEINKVEGRAGESVWEKESFDRLLRSDADVEEKFHYICRNPWAGEVVESTEDYEWVWTWDDRVGVTGAPQDAGHGTLEACAPQRQPSAESRVISGAFAFRLYDEQGFPLDLTELMARERGLTVDTAGFEKLMEEQRERARKAQKKTVIELSEIETKTPTTFRGYDLLSTPATVLEVVALKDKTAVVLDTTTAYAEMGGQVGDTGEITLGAETWRIANTQKNGATWLHWLEGRSGALAAPQGRSGAPAAPHGGSGALAASAETQSGEAPLLHSQVTLTVDRERRRAIERHHSVTHLLHWALHEVVSHEATQKGSFVGPDKLTFDFNSQALTHAQVRDIEWLVNEKIVENAAIAWREVPYAQVKGDASIMQFFGDKYGELVRVVDIGGYSKELCAGTHTRATGEIGLFRIASEAAIAAGVRRIEAQAGLNAYELAMLDTQRLHALATTIGTPLRELEKKIEGMLAHQKELEKALKAAQQREAAGRAKELLASAETIGSVPAIVARVDGMDGDGLQTIADALKSHGFKGVVVLGGAFGPAVALVASVSSDHTAKVQAGKIIQAIAPLVGGKGGGKPDNARGGGKDPSQLDAALAKAKTLLG